MHVVWVLTVILFNCIYGFFVDAVVFCNDVTLVYGSYRKFVDLVWQHLKVNISLLKIPT